MYETKTTECKHGDKPFVCTRTRMLDFLMDRGWEPFKTARDLKNPKYYVWYFENNPAFEEDVTAYFEMCRNRNK